MGCYFAWAVPEFAHLLLVPHQFAIEFLDVDLDRGYPGIRLGQGAVSGGGVWLGMTYGVDGVLECWFGLLVGGRAEYSIHDDEWLRQDPEDNREGIVLLHTSPFGRTFSALGHFLGPQPINAAGSTHRLLLYNASTSMMTDRKSVV